MTARKSGGGLAAVAQTKVVASDSKIPPCTWVRGAPQIAVAAAESALAEAPLWTQREEDLTAQGRAHILPPRRVNPLAHRLLTDPKMEKVWAALRKRSSQSVNQCAHGAIEQSLYLFYGEVLSASSLRVRPTGRQEQRKEFERVATRARRLLVAMDGIHWREKYEAKLSHVEAILSLARARALAISNADLRVRARVARRKLDCADPIACKAEIDELNVLEEAESERKGDPRYWRGLVERPKSVADFRRLFLIRSLAIYLKLNFGGVMAGTLAGTAGVILELDVTAKDVKYALKKRGNKASKKRTSSPA